jgi:peroxiredoxin
MAATPSTMVPLGTLAPDFKLPDTVSGKEMSLADLKGETGTAVLFICNHCPYVRHLNAEVVRVAHEFQSGGISFVAISSNDISSYPEDGPVEMKATAKKLGYPFPYLYDESQEVAAAYDASCTPDFFIYDKNLKLVYRGQFDDSRPGNNKPVTGKDFRMALDALVAGKEIPSQQIPSIGCNIKWR